MAPGHEVRLRSAYLATCTGFKKDGNKIVELACRIDPASRSGDAPDGRKVKSITHWVSTGHASDTEVRLYDRLFTIEDSTGQKDGSFKKFLNPNSLTVLASCKVEPTIKQLKPLTAFQFERLRYFCVDSDSKPGKLVINRTIELRNTWAKVKKQADKK